MRDNNSGMLGDNSDKNDMSVLSINNDIDGSNDGNINGNNNGFNGNSGNNNYITDNINNNDYNDENEKEEHYVSVEMDCQEDPFIDTAQWTGA